MPKVTKHNIIHDTLLKSVETLALLSKNSHLSSEFITENKAATSQVARFFGISEVQSVMLSAMINMNLKNPGIDIWGSGDREDRIGIPDRQEDRKGHTHDFHQ